MTIGDKCICQCDDWVNAFGDKTTVVHCGMRLTVRKTITVGGVRFYEFEETPEGTSFLAMGFKPLRHLN